MPKTMPVEYDEIKSESQLFQLPVQETTSRIAEGVAWRLDKGADFCHDAGRITVEPGDWLISEDGVYFTCNDNDFWLTFMNHYDYD
jgi:hypothetical protein